ncbi:MAG: hypothetical protein BGO51_16445 [Rhodospirillales bacterium 69-11]|nr:MAG: hypothetical protein BGO51_16445 [Rhodospirillales bacterium 69-11]
MSSPNNTIISRPGQSITDSNGNVWTIVGGRVAVNGVVDAGTSNVIEMAYENGTVWQKNADNLWWGKTSLGAAWYPPTGTAIDPIPNQHASLSGSVVVAGSASTVMDASGNFWGISAGHVTLNGVTDMSSARVVEIAYANGRIWQENADHLWWSKAKPSDTWKAAGTASPVLHVTRSWTGTAGSFATQGAWSPMGVPQAGDTAVIGSLGQVSVAAGDATGVAMVLNGGTLQFTQAGTFSLGGISGSGSLYLGYPQQQDVVRTTGLNLSGALYVGEFTGSGSYLLVGGPSTLNAGSSLTVQTTGTAGLPHGRLENDSTMTLNGAALTAGALTGTGTIVATGNSNLVLASAPTSETIQLTSAHLEIGDGAARPSTAMSFMAPVTGFGASSSITLDSTQATSAVFKMSAPTVGEMFLYNGSTLVGDLHIAGQSALYVTDNLAGTPSGSVTITAYDTGHAIPLTH